MREEKQEHFGVVKFIDTKKGFGFISSESDKKDYYFKLSSLQGEVEPHEFVAFILEIGSKGESAKAIRKVYINSNGIKFIARVNRTHIHNGVETYLPNIFEQITEFKEEWIVKSFEFPFIVGKTICVATEKNDKVFYAIRNGRLGHSRFVLNRESLDCNTVTVIMLKVPTHYIIISSFVGSAAAPEPWDKQATSEDLNFWQKHALISGEEEIMIESKTDICPWVLNQTAISKVELNH